MEINLVEIWGHMGLPVKLVVLVLTIQAVACITAVIDRLVLLWLSMRKTKRFAREAAGLVRSSDHRGLLDLASKTKGSHLAEYLGAGVRAFLDARDKSFDDKRSGEMARRALERKGETISQDLHKRMSTLASTGSTAPFVGLLGTVLGIIGAFRMIAATGSGGIGTIGAAIGEALVVTGYGLVVAIPTVLVYNWLSGRIAHYETGLLNAGNEMIDTLEAEAFGGPRTTLEPEDEPCTGEREVAAPAAA